MKYWIIGVTALLSLLAMAPVGEAPSTHGMDLAQAQ
jgi:hypothetical protein